MIYACQDVHNIDTVMTSFFYSLAKRNARALWNTCYMMPDDPFCIHQWSGFFLLNLEIVLRFQVIQELFLERFHLFLLFALRQSFEFIILLPLLKYDFSEDLLQTHYFVFSSFPICSMG